MKHRVRREQDIQTAAYWVEDRVHSARYMTNVERSGGMCTTSNQKLRALLHVEL